MGPPAEHSLANGADALTATRLVAAVAVVFLLPADDWTLPALLVSLVWLTDLLDGRLARLSSRATRLGRYDMVVDTVFGAGMVVGLLAARLLPIWAGLGAIVVFGAIYAAGNVAAAMLLQLTGFVPFLMELWFRRPVTWWAPFTVALLAAVVDWRRLLLINIPAFLRGIGALLGRPARPEETQEGGPTGVP